MMLALVNDERQLRRDLYMIIRPLSDEFIHGSPEALSAECYRVEPRSRDVNYVQTKKFECGERMV